MTVFPNSKRQRPLSASSSNIYCMVNPCKSYVPVVLGGCMGVLSLGHDWCYIKLLISCLYQYSKSAGRDGCQLQTKQAVEHRIFKFENTSHHIIDEFSISPQAHRGSRIPVKKTNKNTANKCCTIGRCGSNNSLV